MSVDETFKRKKYGGGPNWGAGWDKLFSDQWDNLDKLCQDNFYGRHNKHLLNKVSKRLIEVLSQAQLLMKNYCLKTNSKFHGWSKEAKEVSIYLQASQTPSEQMMAITCAEQFLRATNPHINEVRKVLKIDE